MALTLFYIKWTKENVYSQKERFRLYLRMTYLRRLGESPLQVTKIKAICIIRIM